MLIVLPAALESDLQRTTGVTTFEYLVLAHLSEADELTLRMSELAFRASSSLSRLSHVVGRMIKAGWVVKSPCAEDGRVSEVNLTKAGLAKVVEVAPAHVAGVRKFVIDPLTSGQLSLLAEAASAITAQIAGSPDAGTPAPSRSRNP